jgi:redox-sensitive bicupin YhaK (pirin superfamily)
MGFGALRVINDDFVAASMGFETHSHRDMEIISVPLSGSLKHRDTIGNDFVISSGEIQVMSAGTGISHSEFNNSPIESTNFLQIWVLPLERNIAPSYSQKDFKDERVKNHMQLIISPDGRGGSLTINQRAFFSLLELEEDQQQRYEKYEKNNGVYIFVISGEVVTFDETLKSRDGISVDSLDEIYINSSVDSEVLIMEVPLL